MSYQTLTSPRPQLNQRPATPVVPIDRVRPPVVGVTPEELATIRRQLTEFRTELEQLRAKVYQREHSITAVRAARLVQDIANAHGVSYADIMGPRQHTHVTKARKEAYKDVALQCPEWSWPDLGRFFHRDHTTILQTLKKMKVIRGNRG